MAVSMITTADHEAIEAVNRAFSESFSRGSIAAVAERTYTRDAVVLPPGGDAIRGRAAICQFWPAAAAQLGVTNVRLVTEELRPMGDGICEIGRGTLTTSAGIEQIVKYTVVWKREDGAWRVDVDIWN